MKEALISEAPRTHHASGTSRKLATHVGLAGLEQPSGVDITLGTPTVVLCGSHQNPHWWEGVVIQGIGWLLCSSADVS